MTKPHRQNYNARFIFLSAPEGGETGATGRFPHMHQNRCKTISSSQLDPALCL